MTKNRSTAQELIRISQPMQMDLFADASHEEMRIVPLCTIKATARLVEGIQALVKQAIKQHAKELQSSVPDLIAGLSIGNDRIESVVAARGLEALALERSASGLPTLSDAAEQLLRCGIDAMRAIHALEQAGTQNVQISVCKELTPLGVEICPDRRAVLIGSESVAEAMKVVNRFALDSETSLIMGGAKTELPARVKMAISSPLCEQQAILCGRIEDHSNKGVLAFRIARAFSDSSEGSVTVRLPNRELVTLEYPIGLRVPTGVRYLRGSKVALHVRPYELAGTVYGQITQIKKYNDLVDEMNAADQCDE